MKDEFLGFYPPTEAEYEKLVKEGLVVLDTNVLLRLYQFPEAPRAEAIEVLKKIEGRLWLPHFVALEYQQNRVSVIAQGAKSLESIESKIHESLSVVGRLIDELELEKRGIEANTAELQAEIKGVNDKLTSVLAQAISKQLSVSSADPIRDELDQIFKGRIGSAPTSQAAVDALIAEGELRYENRIPPGYKDAAKEKNPDRKLVWHDGLSYPRKFGDLIIWRQLLAHARASGSRKVLLITGDAKEDWWWEEQGKTLGPRHELAREAKKEAGVELFWAYGFPQFLENARKYLDARVSQESIVEIKHVSERPVEDDGVSFARAWARAHARNAVKAYLARDGSLIRRTIAEFPELLQLAGDGPPRGYQVLAVSKLDEDFADRNLGVFSQAETLIKNGEISSFALVVVVPPVETKRGDWNLLTYEIWRGIESFDKCSVVIGYASPEGFVEVERLNSGGLTP